MAAVEDPRMHAAIAQHLALLDLANHPERILESMITKIKTAPKLPDGFIDHLRAAAEAAPVQNLVIRFIAARFAEAKIDAKELEAVNEFFASQVGRKYVAVQPAILEGSNDVVKTWATQLSIKVSNAGLQNTVKPVK